MFKTVTKMASKMAAKMNEKYKIAQNTPLLSVLNGRLAAHFEGFWGQEIQIFSFKMADILKYDITTTLFGGQI